MCAIVASVGTAVVGGIAGGAAGAPVDMRTVPRMDRRKEMRRRLSGADATERAWRAASPARRARGRPSALLLALLLAGCAAPSAAPEPPKGAPAPDAPPEAVTPGEGEARFASTGACVRDGDRLDCFGATDAQEAQLRVARNGTLSLRLVWVPESSQTAELYAFVARKGEKGWTAAQGASPLVVAVAVDEGAHVLGIGPAAKATAGPVRQTAAWTASWTGG
ncbi:MAG TPA: hypothetical protein VNX21_05975 [Candidatus Thermoplasmatota archaeon]|nr:hypothetical protein [Candidatus Thermoplasmatota archaeon]